MRILIVLTYCLFALSSFAQSGKFEDISSTVDSLDNGELIFRHDVLINAPLSEVWAAYTTAQGIKGWIAPVADIDLRTGGLMRTNYDATKTLDDPSSILLTVRNYIPHKMLTLQASLTNHFEGFTKEEQGNMYNVVLFEAISKKKTRLISYGLGYKKEAKYLALLKFFIPANEWTYQQLKNYVEKGIQSDFKYE